MSIAAISGRRARRAAGQPGGTAPPPPMPEGNGEPGSAPDRRNRPVPETGRDAHQDDGLAEPREGPSGEGARTALSERFVQEVLADWEANGAAAIAQARAEKPLDYVKLLVAALPKASASEKKVNELDALSDEQLGRQLAAVLSKLAGMGFAIGAGAGAAEAPQPARDLPAL